MEGQYQRMKNDREYEIRMRSRTIDSNSEMDTRRAAKIIMFNIIIGQILSIISVLNNISLSTIQTKYNFTFPLIQMSSYYAVLALFWILLIHKIRCPRFSYIFIAIFDSQGNFLIIYACTLYKFQYPAVVPIFNVILTLLFSWGFIRGYSYRKLHICGVLIAVLGIGLCTYGYLSDILNPFSQLASNYTGLILCICASICFSLSSVLQEIYFHSGEDIYYFFPWLGICGCLITFGESFLLSEVYKLPENSFGYMIITLWIGFAVTLAFLTSISPFFIKRCSAVMFCISLVTQIIWSYIFDVVSNQVSPKNYFYYISFVLIVIGIIVFNQYRFNTLGTIEEDKSSNTVSKFKVHGNLFSNESQMSQTAIINDAVSETSECSAFSSNERKYSYYKNKQLASTIKYIAND